MFSRQKIGRSPVESWFNSNGGDCTTSIAISLSYKVKPSSWPWKKKTSKEAFFFLKNTNKFYLLWLFCSLVSLAFKNNQSHYFSSDAFEREKKITIIWSCTCQCFSLCGLNLPLAHSEMRTKESLFRVAKFKRCMNARKLFLVPVNT